MSGFAREQGDFGEDALGPVAQDRVHLAVLDVSVRIAVVAISRVGAATGITVGVDGPLGVLQGFLAGAIARVGPFRQRQCLERIIRVGEVIEKSSGRRRRVGQWRNGHCGSGQYLRRIEGCLLSKRWIQRRIGLHVRATGPTLTVDDQAAVLRDDFGFGDDRKCRERRCVDPGIAGIVVVAHGMRQKNVRVRTADRPGNGHSRSIASTVTVMELVTPVISICCSGGVSRSWKLHVPGGGP